MTCAIALCAAAVRADDAPRMSVKRLFAPAADVEQGVVALPSPEATPTRSRAAVFTASFVPATERARVVRFEFVHAGGALRLIPLGVDACRWRGRLFVGVQAIPLQGSDALVARVTEEFASQAAFGIEDATRAFELDAPAGDCVVEFWSEVPAGTGAALVVDDGAGEKDGPALVAHLASRVNRAGCALEFVVRGELAGRRGPLGGRAAEVTAATVSWRDGVVERAQLVRGAKDGSVRVTFARARAGDAIVRIDGFVLDARGASRQRSLFVLARIADGAMMAARCCTPIARSQIGSTATSPSRALLRAEPCSRPQNSGRSPARSRAPLAGSAVFPRSPSTAAFRSCASGSTAGGSTSRRARRSSSAASA
ncbi:MAG: hypothetical protein NTU45_10325, partial [Planctomycetota bacterium]|nr:hypothetical protein [Planctomycetota bacterium]